MSLTGIILDVSQSMQSNIKSDVDEQCGPWAECIFKVIDDLVKYDVLPDNRVFAIGVGANCRGKEIFDVIGTVKQIKEIMQTPATEEHINSILDILEKNGARNIRKWARNVALIQETVTDYTATMILWKLESDEEFRKTFTRKFLPKPVPDTESNKPDVKPNVFGRRSDKLRASFNSRLKPAKRKHIEEIVKNAKSHIISTGQWIRLKFYSVEGSFRVLKEEGTSTTFSVKDARRILKGVGTRSIFSVQDAFSIIRGRVDEDDSSTERRQELRKELEPFIFGLTPLYQSLEKATELFEDDLSKTKLLFVLSDGQPTDGNNEDSNKISKITSKLRRAGVKVVSCFITKSTDIHPKRLYDEMAPGWEPGAKFLFSLSSEVPTQHLPRAILVKRGWTIDIANNETKLFIQVNHPDNLRY